MRRAQAVLLIAVGCLGLLGLLAFALLSKPATPVALLTVVDSGGKPVPGAVITPDGLRAKKDGSHYGWRDGDPKPATTDRAGIARVQYPFYVTERLETSEISFEVDHPDFCPDRPFAVVDPSPPKNARFKEKAKYWWSRIVGRQITSRPAPIVLKRGAIVELTCGAAADGITSIKPQFTSAAWPSGKFWLETGTNVFVSKRVTPGTNWGRLLGFPRAGTIHFSDCVPVIAISGQTNRLRLDLKPGLTLRGRLADSVPRPVTNGRVVTRTFSPSDSAAPRPLTWLAWCLVDSDGTFIFESLPPGDVNLIVLCDGFVSQNDSRNPMARRRTPQVFTVTHDADVVVAMEPTATCEITVLDDAGQPVENAEVALWPNVTWGRSGSTIFADPLVNSEDSFRSGSRPDWQKSWPGLFKGQSDKNGVAVVTNLPAYSANQSFAVEHENFEMPVTRDRSGDGHRYGIIYTGPGETNRVTVRMQKKGTQFIEHAR
jgi:hypothetical protein